MVKKWPIIRYIEDGTAGIALYDLTTNNYLSNVLRGDSISITGELADYNGLLEVYVAGSPIITNSNNPLPVPQSVTPIRLEKILRLNWCKLIIQFSITEALFLLLVHMILYPMDNKEKCI